MHTLYHFQHCPYCIRVRMALGYLHIEHTSIIVGYDDRATPEALTGVKMLPILTLPDGRSLNESLSIIQAVDPANSLCSDSPELPGAVLLAQRLGDAIHPLVIPYWVMLPEFSDSARRYFLDKQRKKRGSLAEILANRDPYRAALPRFFAELRPILAGRSHESSKLTIVDIVVAAHLWALYLVPEVQLPLWLHRYLQHVKEQTRFDYLGGLWSNPTSLGRLEGLPSDAVNA
ncbi:hypothetical protein FAZ69_25675 [Trinickia terrae]|uniref:GST N-terminal domain-containing protein n=1 Tax=Trinickia terrae TaxID=2571161 RepID=A0A4U1HSU4_9BURK|nr:glutathione S-transferase N-terminal domain-containing protein [Trinickia terrae]TKC83087.1 hypothetical protein FAZ69_25675 [Trinickia terrae]